MSEKLRSCPFCGAAAITDHVEMGAFSYWRSGCVNVDCPVRPETDGFETEAEAVEAWNHREEVSE